MGRISLKKPYFEWLIKKMTRRILKKSLRDHKRSVYVYNKKVWNQRLIKMDSKNRKVVNLKHLSEEQYRDRNKGPNNKDKGSRMHQ